MNPYPDDVVIRPTILGLPADIDPAVLKPGATVVAFLDGAHTRLTVLRVEPMLVCRGPDGSEISVYAHEVYVPDEAARP